MYQPPGCKAASNRAQPWTLPEMFFDWMKNRVRLRGQRKTIFRIHGEPSKYCWSRLTLTLVSPARAFVEPDCSNPKLSRQTFIRRRIAARRSRRRVLEVTPTPIAAPVCSLLESSVRHPQSPIKLPGAGSHVPPRCGCTRFGPFCSKRERCFDLPDGLAHILIITRLFVAQKKLSSILFEALAAGSGKRHSCTAHPAGYFARVRCT